MKNILQRYSSSGKALRFLSIRGRFLINNVLGILYSILPGNNKQGYYVTALQRRLFAVERTNVSVLYICSVFLENYLQMTYMSMQLFYKMGAFAGYGWVK
ncbi:hypothetical protein K070079E91_42730 [Eisenbergiella porci]